MPYFQTMSELLAIGEVARRSGVASSALRFYEQRGLISSERAGSGHRHYLRPVFAGSPSSSSRSASASRSTRSAPSLPSSRPIKRLRAETGLDSPPPGPGPRRNTPENPHAHSSLGRGRLVAAIMTPANPTADEAPSLCERTVVWVATTIDLEPADLLGRHQGSHLLTLNHRKVQQHLRPGPPQGVPGSTNSQNPTITANPLRRRWDRTCAGHVTALVEPWQPVIGERFPRRGIRHELPYRRTDARIAVECSHPNADRLGMAGVRAVDRRSAFAAEPLLTAVRWFPHSQLLLPRHDPERALGRVRLHRCCSPASPLASLAVAVACAYERLAHFVANRATVTAAGERESHGTWILSALARVRQVPYWTPPWSRPSGTGACAGPAPVAPHQADTRPPASE